MEPSLILALSTLLKFYVPLHLLGYCCFLTVGTWLLHRQRQEWSHLVALTVLLILTDTLLAHLAFIVNHSGFAALLNWRFWHPFQPPYWGAPLLFAVGCAAYFLVRRSAVLLDVTCIAWACANVCFKLACWWFGCCGGVPSRLPWCRWSGGRHPTQLYEALAHAALGATLLLLFRRGFLKGRLVLVTGALFGIMRFSLDGLRRDSWFPVAGYSLTQVIAGFVGLACALLLLLLITIAGNQLARRRAVASAPKSDPTRATSKPRQRRPHARSH